MKSKRTKISAITKLLEKYSGKKVILKEADEAAKNQAITILQSIQTSIGTMQDNLSELYDIPIMNKERNSKINILHSQLGKIQTSVDNLISTVTGISSEEQLEEDVTMTSDDIIKKPDVVKKLNDRKIDVRVKDDNSPSSKSTSSSSNISMSSASF